MQSKNIGVKFTALIACRNFNFLSLHYEGIYCARCTGSVVPNITDAAMDFFRVWCGGNISRWNARCLCAFMSGTIASPLFGMNGKTAAALVTTLNGH